MKTTTVEKLVWILVYGGLLVMGLGLSVARSDGALGTGLAIGGGIAASLGVALIFVRARMKDKPEP